MKRRDLILAAIALFLLLMIAGKSWLIILKILLGVILFCTVLHWKITPFKDQLFPRFKKYYYLFDSIFNKFQLTFKGIPKFQLGQHIQLDMTYLAIISTITLILIIL